MSPTLGCYGDSFARTPNLDAFAEESILYTNAFAASPVCSPSRSTLITGMYNASMGTNQMRSSNHIPTGVKGFPSLLRKAGYYTSNNVKTDYNCAENERLIKESWNLSSDGGTLERSEARPAVLRSVQRHDDTPVTHHGLALSRFSAARPVTSVEAGDQRSRMPSRCHLTTRTLRSFARRWPGSTTASRSWIKNVQTHPRPVGRGRAGRRHDRVLLLRPRLRHAAAQATAARFGNARRPDGSLPEKVPTPRSRSSRHPTGPARQLRRFPGDGSEPDRTTHSGLHAGNSLPGPKFGNRTGDGLRHAGSSRRGHGDGAIRCGTNSFCMSETTCPICPTTSPASSPILAQIRNDITRAAKTNLASLTAPQRAYAGPRKPVEEFYDCIADPDNIVNLLAGELNPEQQAALERLRGSLRQNSQRRFWMSALSPESVMRDHVREEGAPIRDILEGKTNHAPDLDAAWAAADVVGTKNRDSLVRHLKSPNAADRYWAIVGMRVDFADDSALHDLAASHLTDVAADVRIEAASWLAEILRSISRPRSRKPH